MIGEGALALSEYYRGLSSLDGLQRCELTNNNWRTRIRHPQESYPDLSTLDGPLEGRASVSLEGTFPSS